MSKWLALARTGTPVPKAPLAPIADKIVPNDANGTIGTAPRGEREAIEHRSGAWWHDPAEVLARFDESAGFREFDLGLTRREAETIAAEAVLTELQVMGLDPTEAEAVLTSARARQRRAHH